MCEACRWLCQLQACCRQGCRRSTEPAAIKTIKHTPCHHCGAQRVWRSLGENCDVTALTCAACALGSRVLRSSAPTMILEAVSAASMSYSQTNQSHFRRKSMHLHGGKRTKRFRPTKRSSLADNGLESARIVVDASCGASVPSGDTCFSISRYRRPF